MSFLGGFLTPPPSLKQYHTGGEVTDKPPLPPSSIYNALSGVKSMVSSYSTPFPGASRINEQLHPQQEKEMELVLQRFRLQSPASHLGMLVAFSDQSLSPLPPDHFLFSWHRIRTTAEVSRSPLESVHNYNALTRLAHSWYPPTADDLGCTMVLGLEDSLGLGLSRQLRSLPVEADEVFKSKVEGAVGRGQVLERVVISTCSLPCAPRVQHRHKSRLSSGNIYSNGDGERHAGGPTEGDFSEEEEEEEDEDEDDASSSSSGSSGGVHVAIPDFEVGGSIAVNSEGILLRERNQQDCGLHIDSTRHLSLTCVHPSSFILELPLYYSASGTGEGQEPLSSVRDLTTISDDPALASMRPSVEWLGEGAGSMFASLEEVVCSEEREEEGSKEGSPSVDLLFSSLRLQVTCRDRCSRDALVLAIRSLAGVVLPPAPPKEQQKSWELKQRLALLPWRSSCPDTDADTVPDIGPDKGCKKADTLPDTVTGGSECEHFQSDKAKELETIIAQTTTEKEERVKELTFVKEELQKQSAARHALAAEVEALEEQVQSGISLLQASVKREDSLRGDVHALQERAETEVIRLKGQVNEENGEVVEPTEVREAGEDMDMKTRCAELSEKLRESEALVASLRDDMCINDNCTDVVDVNFEKDTLHSELKRLVEHYHMEGIDSACSNGGNDEDCYSLQVGVISCFISTLQAQLDSKQGGGVEEDGLLEEIGASVDCRSCRDHKETIAGLNESVSVLQSKARRSEEARREEGTVVASLQSEVEVLQEKHSSVEEHLEEARGETTQATAECARLKEVVRTLQEAAGVREKASAVLKRDLDTMSVRLQEEKQKREILAQVAERDANASKIKSDKLTYDLSQANDTVKVLEARIQGLQTETLTLSDERQVLKRQKSAFESSRHQIAQLRGQLNESDQSAQATRALLAETTALHQTLQKEYSDVKVELSNVNSLLAQKCSRLDELKDRIQVMDNEITSADKVKTSFRRENARLKEAAKKLKEDSETAKTLKPLYQQQLSKIAHSQSRVVDLESALSDCTSSRNESVLERTRLELQCGVLEKRLVRREVLGERESMAGEDCLATAAILQEQVKQHQHTISRLQQHLSEAKMAEPFELKRLNFLVSKLSGEKNHFESKAKSLSKDLQRKLLAGTPLQRELGKVTARMEEVENERNAYRDAMVLACETYSAKEVSSWFG